MPITVSRLLCYLLLLCCMGGEMLFGQDLATIQEDIRNTPEGATKIELLIESSRTLSTRNPREAIGFADEALKLSQKLRDRPGVVNSYSNLGLVYMNQDKYQLARQNLEKGINLRKKLISNDKRQNLSIAKDYRRIGICHEKQNQTTKARDAYQLGVRYGLKTKDREEIALGYNSLGESHLKLENYQDAHRSFTRALPLARQAGQRKLSLTIEKNLASSYALLQNYMEVEAYKSELEVYEEQITEVRDSLSIEQEAKEVLVSEKKLLNLEKSRREAELKAKEADLENAQMKIEKQELETQQLYLGGAAALILFSMIIVGVISRSIERKKQTQAVEREKKKTDDLLHNILPAKIAEELKQNSRVAPKLHNDVTILFTDFKGFTAIAANMDPDDLVKKLGVAFQKFDELIEKYGLEKIKTIGDAYMAVGGLVKEDPQHAIKTIAAAMEMQEFMDSWTGRQRRAGQEAWELRIGIHSGPVIAGVIGERKFAYDIWGDAVNIASRMESYGEAGKVNISEDTKDRVKQLVECESRRLVEVKNRGMVPMYFVKRITARQKSASTAASPRR